LAQHPEPENLETDEELNPLEFFEKMLQAVFITQHIGSFFVVLELA
jgi:hypothetical protein